MRLSNMIWRNEMNLLLHHLQNQAQNRKGDLFPKAAMTPCKEEWGKDKQMHIL